MNFQNIIPDKTVSLFVKSIMVFEEAGNEQKTVLPFFADGYPGLIFYQAPKELVVYPHNKKMTTFFLYGQTLHPMELVFDGSYKMVVFQFYPFIIKKFFNIEPQSINDGCYDLEQSKNIETETLVKQLQTSSTSEDWVALISNFLYSIFQTKRQLLDEKLKQALQLMADNKGQQTIKDLCSKLKINERTFERRFLSETGILPKHFAKILQFQSSLEQLSVKDYNKLTDIVYENGYADQSHFIKVFKAFTGKTPQKFSKK